jgi:hypothetical protein
MKWWKPLMSTVESASTDADTSGKVFLHFRLRPVEEIVEAQLAVGRKSAERQQQRLPDRHLAGGRRRSSKRSGTDCAYACH